MLSFLWGLTQGTPGVPLDSPYIGNNMVLPVLHRSHQVPVEISVDALLGVPI